MSVLETPRIFFRGQISWDPIVTNNDRSNYNENAAETVFDSVDRFRQRAIDQVASAGNWNPHGTHRSSLFDAGVCGVDTGTGWSKDDSFVSKPVALTGMLVDLEPYGNSSSQLFFDSLQFGVRGAERISARGGARFVARYINTTRNLANAMIAGRASVTWQTSFPRDGLDIDPSGSAVLEALTRELGHDDVLGLTVRFNAYRTVYFGNKDLRDGGDGVSDPQPMRAAEQALKDKLAAGFQPNPTRSLVVGVVGLWRQGEPAQEPGDRALITQTQPPPPPAVASAHARVVGNDLVLDLSNSIPEVPAGGDELAKKDVGTLTVQAVDPAGATPPQNVGQIGHDEYARSAYEDRAGIVTVPLSGAMAGVLATRNIRITQADGTVLLAEVPRRAIPLTPCLYLDEGLSRSAEFQVYERGRIAGPGVPVTLSRFGANGDLHERLVVATNAQGRFSYSAVADAGKVFTVVPAFSTAEMPARGPLPQVHTYLAVRVLPADSHLLRIRDVTWPVVYESVLANWNAMAPCMDNWLDLKDGRQVKAHAAVLKRLTDPAMFESYRFMPVTRDMTAGERALLNRFLDAPDDGQLEASADEVQSAGGVQPSSVDLSRSLGGG